MKPVYKTIESDRNCPKLLSIKLRSQISDSTGICSTSISQSSSNITSTSHSNKLVKIVVVARRGKGGGGTNIQSLAHYKSRSAPETIETICKLSKKASRTMSNAAVAAVPNSWIATNFEVMSARSGEVVAACTGANFSTWPAVQ
jgi:hypothetical protein